jgi:hypothetical protein
MASQAQENEWEGDEYYPLNNFVSKFEVDWFGFLWELCLWKIKESEVSQILVEKKPSEKSEFMHINVWVLPQVSSLGISSYYVTFIDEATRRT